MYSYMHLYMPTSMYYTLHAHMKIYTHMQESLCNIIIQHIPYMTYSFTTVPIRTGTLQCPFPRINKSNCASFCRLIRPSCLAMEFLVCGGGANVKDFKICLDYRQRLRPNSMWILVDGEQPYSNRTNCTRSKTLQKIFPHVSRVRWPAFKVRRQQRYRNNVKTHSIKRRKWSR